MTSGRKSLCWFLVFLAVIVLVLLFYLDADASAIAADECYLGEHCYVVWPPWESEYCNGGIYTLNFCYSPEDPYNGELWHYHATCDSSIIPPIIHRSTVYLPIVYKSETYDTTFLTCAYDIEDSWSVKAGTVTAWIQVEYHPDGPIRLKSFFDKYEPNPTYQFTYSKWYGTPANSLFEVRHLDTEDPDVNWNSTYAESISTWEAITHLGENKSYTLNPVAFKKGHQKYPISCVKVPYYDDDDDDEDR